MASSLIGRMEVTELQVYGKNFMELSTQTGTAEQVPERKVEMARGGKGVGKGRGDMRVEGSD